MTNFVGIDISQAYFDAALMIDRQIVAEGRFDNNKAGFKQFRNWLNKRQSAPVHITLEATGVYGEAFVEWLYARDEVVSVVNPAQIKAYGQAQLRRAKTDKADARLIADFGRTQTPPAWSPPAPEVKHLRGLLRYLTSLQDECQRERNRLHAQRLPELQAMHREHIAYLQARIAELKARIQAHIRAYPALAQTVALLRTIVGVGPIVAWYLVAEIDIARFASAKELVAFLGLNPHIRRSGKRQTTATPISKMGNATLRRILYMPTINAKQNNLPVKQLYDRLIERGKHKAVARIAAMRKLVHIIYGVWTSGQAFDAQFETNQLTCAA